MDDNIIREKYQNNSYKKREEKKRTEKQAMKGTVKKEKSSVGRRMLKTFIVADIHDVAEEVLYEEIVPAIKTMIQNGIQYGVETLLGNKAERKPQKSEKKGNVYVKYDGYFDEKHDNIRKKRDRVSYDFDTITFQYYEDAAGILDQMKHMVNEDGAIEVADFYNFVDIDPDIRDSHFGWDDLRYVRVKRNRYGTYFIDLPLPIELD